MECLDESVRSKRAKSTVPVRAAVPVWRSYNNDEISTFGVPSVHEEKYGRRLSPNEYTASVANFVTELSTNIRFQRFYIPIRYNFLYMRLTFGSSVAGENAQLILSDIIFDNWAGVYEIAHIMLWVAAESCIRNGMSNLVVSNPLPLVQRTLRSISECYGFRFIDFVDLGSAHIYAMCMDTESIKLFVGTVQTKYGVSFDTLATCHKRMETDMRLFTSIVPFNTLKESSLLVSSGYLDNFSHFLLKLHRSFKIRLVFNGFTDVARVQVSIEQADSRSYAALNMLDVRPCAQRLQFARIVFWRMIRSCVLEGFYRLAVNVAYRHTAALCESLGFTRIKIVQDDLGIDSGGIDSIDSINSIDSIDSIEETEYQEDRNYEIHLDTMKKMMLSSQCGIADGKLRENPFHPEFFELDANAFPTSDQLNCQAYADARKAS